MNFYCRFCGLQKKERDVIHLFNHKIILEKFYTPAEMVNLIFKDVQITEHDEFSKEICSQCINNVFQCFRFHNVIKNAQIKLMEILQQKKCNAEKKFKLILPSAENVSKIDFTNNASYFEKRMYICYECPQKYRALRQLKKHQEEIHMTENLCNFCNIWFDQSMNVQQHILKQHKSSYECFKCKIKSFTSQRRLFNHCKKKHFAPNGIFKCATCQTEFFGRKNLSQHIEGIHKKTNCFENENCDKNNMKNIEMQSDIRNKNYKMNEIFNDEFKVIDKNESSIDNKFEEAMDVEFLDEFFLNQHADNSFEFNECWDALDLSFEDDIKMKMSDLAYEMLPHLQKQDEFGQICQYQCPHCKKGFIRQIGVLIHLAHEHNMPVLSCDTCSEKFSNIDDYKMHKIQHLGKNVTNRFEETQIEIIQRMGKIIYMCKCCHRKYKEKNNFVLHICKSESAPAELNKTPTFICNLCEKQFLCLKEMYLHKRITHLNKNLECVKCKKKFKSISGFQYHLKTHKGEKSLKCPFCDRNFLTKINLNSHIKIIHSIVKNQLCTLCDRNFATLDHLKKHVMSVHQKERSHLCSVCGKLFSQVSHLKSHFKIHNVNLNTVI